MKRGGNVTRAWHVSVGLATFMPALFSRRCERALTNTPTSSKRTPMSAESTSSGDVDRVVIQPWATTFLPESVVKKCIASLSVIILSVMIDVY